MVSSVRAYATQHSVRGSPEGDRQMWRYDNGCFYSLILGSVVASQSFKILQYGKGYDLLYKKTETIPSLGRGGHVIELPRTAVELLTLRR